jgi:hypothetical protein
MSWRIEHLGGDLPIALIELASVRGSLRGPPLVVGPQLSRDVSGPVMTGLCGWPQT